MKYPITYSVTYVEYTPESIEYGVPDETGFEEIDSTCDFRDLVDMLKNKFNYDKSQSPICLGNLENMWFNTEIYITCYSEMRDRQESLHIAKDPVSQRALRRALKYIGEL